MSKIQSSAAQGLGARLKTAREALGLKQADLAKMVGVSRTAITQWEAGTTYPNFERTIEAANALDVTPQWLAFGAGDNAGNVIRSAEAQRVDVVQLLSATDRKVIDSHYLAKGFIEEKRILSSTSLFFVRHKGGSLKGYEASGYLLVDGSDTTITGHGEFLLWTGFDSEIASVSSNIGDPTKVVVKMSSLEAPQAIAAEALVVLGQVRGALM